MNLSKDKGFPENDPRGEYASRLEARRALSARLGQQHVRIGNLRFGVAVVFGGMLWASVWRGAFSPWWLLAPAAGFATLVVVHDRALLARARASRAVEAYQRGKIGRASCRERV